MGGKRKIIVERTGAETMLDGPAMERVGEIGEYPVRRETGEPVGDPMRLRVVEVDRGEATDRVYVEVVDAE